MNPESSNDNVDVEEMPELERENQEPVNSSNELGDRLVNDDIVEENSSESEETDEDTTEVEEEEILECSEERCGSSCSVCAGSHCYKFCFLTGNYFVQQIEKYSNGKLPTKYYRDQLA